MFRHSGPHKRTMNMNDILDNKSLKTMPYSTPEGYFDNLQSSLLKQATGKQSRRWPAYIAIAASFALLILAGGMIFNTNSPSEFSQEDYITFSDDMTSTIMYEEDLWYADAATEEDMIEYLIYIGTEIDELY